ncbi:hypothetical protein S83_009138 [Arachis hypogaea]
MATSITVQNTKPTALVVLYILLPLLPMQVRLAKSTSVPQGEHRVHRLHEILAASLSGFVAKVVLDPALRPMMLPSMSNQRVIFLFYFLLFPEWCFAMLWVIFFISSPDL